LQNGEAKVQAQVEWSGIIKVAFNKHFVQQR